MVRILQKSQFISMVFCGYWSTGEKGLHYRDNRKEVYPYVGCTFFHKFNL